MNDNNSINENHISEIHKILLEMKEYKKEQGETSDRQNKFDRFLGIASLIVSIISIIGIISAWVTAHTTISIIFLVLAIAELFFSPAGRLDCKLFGLVCLFICAVSFRGYIEAKNEKQETEERD